MQDLIVGSVYEGVLNRGPCKGTVVLLKYKGDNTWGIKDAKFFEVLKDVEFGVDAEFPEDDGWWLVGETVCLSDSCYDFTLYNPSLENK